MADAFEGRLVAHGLDRLSQDPAQRRPVEWDGLACARRYGRKHPGAGLFDRQVSQLQSCHSRKSPECAAGLLQQPHAFDHHGLIGGLEHVVEGQAGD